MPKGGGREPVGRQDLSAAPSPPHASGFVFDYREGRVNCGVVGVADLPSDLVGAGRSGRSPTWGIERAVEARHPFGLAGHQRAAVPVAAGEDVAELPAIGFRQPARAL